MIPTQNQIVGCLPFELKMRGLLNHLNSNKIQSRPFWTPMNNLPMYKDLLYINEDNISSKIFKECISVPSSSNLTKLDQQRVIFRN